MNKYINAFLTILILTIISSVFIYFGYVNIKALVLAEIAGIIAGIIANISFGYKFYHTGGIIGGIVVGLAMVLL
jgi:hypothetical protein